MNATAQFRLIPSVLPSRYPPWRVKITTIYLFFCLSFLYFAKADVSLGRARKLTRLTANARTSEVKISVPQKGNVNQIWNINADDFNSTVQVELSSDDKLPCRFNFLRIKVYDGSNASAELIGRWCEANPGLFVSSGQNLFIVLTVKGRNRIRKFSMSYVAVPNTGRARKSTRLEAKPSIAAVSICLPAKVPVYQSWYISADDYRSTVRIELSSKGISFCRDNSFVIKVYDGPDASTDQIDRLCGRQKGIFNSSGRKMFIVLTVNGQSKIKQFSMRYLAVRKPGLAFNSTSRLTAHSVYSLVYIVVPRWDHIIQRWYITADDQSMTVRIELLRIGGWFCHNDSWVQVYESDPTELIGKWCGAKTGVFDSSGRTLLVVLNVDGRNAIKQFSMRYETVHKAEDSSDDTKSRIIKIFFGVAGAVALCFFGKLIFNKIMERYTHYHRTPGDTFSNRITDHGTTAETEEVTSPAAAAEREGLTSTSSGAPPSYDRVVCPTAPPAPPPSYAEVINQNKNTI